MNEKKISMIAGLIALISLVFSIGFWFSGNRTTISNLNTKIQTIEKSLKTQIDEANKTEDELTKDIDQLRNSIKTNTQKIEKIESYYSKLPKGTILPWDPTIRDSSGIPTGNFHSIPDGWRMCNGLNSTPNLSGRFLMGSNDLGEVRKTGGRIDIPNGGTHNHSGSVSSSCGARDASGFQASGNNCRLISNSLSVISDGNHNHGGENRPPYYTVIYITKVS